MSFAPWYPEGGAESTSFRPSHPWDQIKLVGHVVPCHHARVTSASVALLADKKKTLGGNGAHPTYHGIDPQPLAIDFFFSTTDQLDPFADYMRIIGPGINKTPEPVAIEAQQLKHLGALTTVVLRKVGAIVEAGQYKKVTVEFDHWLNPPVAKGGKKANATTTPKRGKNAVEEAAAKKRNPAPSTQPNFCGPGGAS